MSKQGERLSDEQLEEIRDDPAHPLFAWVAELDRLRAELAAALEIVRAVADSRWYMAQNSQSHFVMTIIPPRDPREGEDIIEQARAALASISAEASEASEAQADASWCAQCRRVETPEHVREHEAAAQIAMNQTISALTANGQFREVTSAEAKAEASEAQADSGGKG